MTRTEIKYGRTVQIAPYESLRIELTQEFKIGNMSGMVSSEDEAFKRVQYYVDNWVEQTKNRLRGIGNG